MKGHGGRGGAGGVSRGFQTVGEATRVADGGGGVGPGVVVEASLRQTDSGHGAGGRESGQAGQTVPHVVQDPGVAWRHARQEPSGWSHPQAGGRRELTDEGVPLQKAASLFLQNVSNSKAVRKNGARRDADCSWIPFPGFPIC